MQIVESEIPNVVFSPQRPNYNANNPILRVVRAVERVQLAAERESYLADSLQYLFPYRDLALYSPGGGEAGNADPRFQENKEDFQKQNIADFKLRDLQVVRGYASAGNWIGPFVQVSYRGAGTELERLNGGPLGPAIQMWIKIGPNVTPSLVRLPYNDATDRYEVEMWGFTGGDLRGALEGRARASFDAGRLVPRPDLIRGTFDDFHGPAFDAERENANRAQPDPQATALLGRTPDHAMHPVRPLRIELAFTNADASQWDSVGGRNHRLEFNMLLRGWKNYLAVGVSPNPHGGVGFLEFRNLFSNYFGYERQRRAAFGPLWENELGRDLDWWNHDANTWEFGDRLNVKSGARRERFMAVDYMDLHLLQPDCGIGVHRHRDNQEVFLMLHGKGMMVVGDWCQFPNRERCFEVRTMLPGDLTVCKTGQLHALYNKTDAPCELFMFGGYD